MKYFVFAKEIEKYPVESNIFIFEKAQPGFVRLVFLYTGEIRNIKIKTMRWKLKRKVIRSIKEWELAGLLLKENSRLR